MHILQRLLRLNILLEKESVLKFLLNLHCLLQTYLQL